jgi:hypothetical protein
MPSSIQRLCAAVVPSSGRLTDGPPSQAASVGGLIIFDAASNHNRIAKTCSPEMPSRSTRAAAQRCCRPASEAFIRVRICDCPNKLCASFIRWTVQYRHYERTMDYFEYNRYNRHCGRRRAWIFSFSRRGPNRDLSWYPVNHRCRRIALADPQSVYGSKTLVHS